MEFVGYTDWAQLPENAERLFAVGERESVFFSRQWLENVSRNPLKEDQALLLACVVDEDRVLAILPLMSGDGQHWASLGHLYTSLYSVLAEQQVQQAILDCLAAGLAHLPVTSLRLVPVAEDDDSLQRLQQAMETAGFFCHRYFRFYNWSHRTAAGERFADYMAGRPGKVRNTIARKQRKLAREHGYRIRLFTEGGQELQQGLKDYTSVYNASWKAHEQFGRFVEDLADQLATRGWLRLAVLYVGEQPVAAQFWFVVHGKASIFKLAYDEAWKRYSPGSILIAYLMEQVINRDRVKEIDFLTGNDAYKMDWMSQRRVRWGLYCAKPMQQKTRFARIADAAQDWVRKLNGTLRSQRDSVRRNGPCSSEFRPYPEDIA